MREVRAAILATVALVALACAAPDYAHATHGSPDGDDDTDNNNLCREDLQVNHRFNVLDAPMFEGETVSTNLINDSHCRSVYGTPDDQLRIELIGEPDFVTLVEENGLLSTVSYAPTHDDHGVYEFMARVDDPDPRAAIEEYPLSVSVANVDRDLVVTRDEDQTVMRFWAANYIIRATDPDASGADGDRITFGHTTDGGTSALAEGACPAGDPTGTVCAYLVQDTFGGNRSDTITVTGVNEGGDDPVETITITTSTDEIPSDDFDVDNYIIVCDELAACTGRINIGLTSVNLTRNIEIRMIDPPSGASITNEDGLSRDFSWTPTEEQDGTYLVAMEMVRTTDDTVLATVITPIIVREVNTDPAELPAPSIPDFGEDETLMTDAITATDSDRVYDHVSDTHVPNTLTFELTNSTLAGLGMEVDPATGALSWSPFEDQDNDDYALRDDGLTVRDGAGGSADLGDVNLAEFKVTESNEPPQVVNPPADLDSMAGTELSADLSGVFADGDNEYVDSRNRRDDLVTVTVSGQPSWMSFDEGTDILSGTPTQQQLDDGEASYTVTVTGTDRDGETATATFTVGTDNQPPEFVSAAFDVSSDLIVVTFSEALSPVAPVQFLDGDTRWLSVSGHSLLDLVDESPPANTFQLVLSVSVAEDATVTIGPGANPPADSAGNVLIDTIDLTNAVPPRITAAEFASATQIVITVREALDRDTIAGGFTVDGTPVNDFTYTDGATTVTLTIPAVADNTIAVVGISDDPATDVAGNAFDAAHEDNTRTIGHNVPPQIDTSGITAEYHPELVELSIDIPVIDLDERNNTFELVSHITPQGPDATDPTFGRTPVAIAPDVAADAETLRITWTPAEADDGTHTVTIRVEDADDPTDGADGTFELNVAEVNRSPTVSGMPEVPQARDEDEPFEITRIRASDPDIEDGDLRQTLSLSLAGNAVAMAQDIVVSLDDQVCTDRGATPRPPFASEDVGCLSWHPDETSDSDPSGTSRYNVGVTVSDGTSDYDASELADGSEPGTADNLTRYHIREVNAPPVLVGQDSLRFALAAGTEFSVDLGGYFEDPDMVWKSGDVGADDATPSDITYGPDTIEVTVAHADAESTLPDWLLFDAATNVLSATPTAENLAGLGELAVSVSGDDCDSDTDPDSADNCTSTALGFEITLRELADAQNLPRPKTDAELADDGLDAGFRSERHDVAEDSVEPFDDLIDYFTEPDEDPDSGMSFELVGAPDWITLTDNGRTISASPANEHVGEHAIKYKVLGDGDADNFDHDLLLRVTNVNDAPVPAPGATLDAGSVMEAADEADLAYQLAGLFNDDDIVHGDELIYSVSGAPGWLSVTGGDPQLLRVATIPPETVSPDEDTKTFEFTVRATDTGEDDQGGTPVPLSADQTVSITVIHVNQPPQPSPELPSPALLVPGTSYMFDLSRLFPDVDGDEFTIAVSVGGAAVPPSAYSLDFPILSVEIPPDAQLPEGAVEVVLTDALGASSGPLEISVTLDAVPDTPPTDLPAPLMESGSGESPVSFEFMPRAPGSQIAALSAAPPPGTTGSYTVTVQEASSALGLARAAAPDADAGDLSEAGGEPIQFVGGALNVTVEPPMRLALTLTYDEPLLGIAEEELAVWHFAGGSWSQLDAEHDAEANTLRVEPDTLSPFALGAQVQLGGPRSCNDCTPPTLGYDSDGIKRVSGGFEYNGRATDVEYFYTPFPQITAAVGEENKAVLRIYENLGAAHVAYAGIAFGLSEGRYFSESQAAVEVRIAYDGTLSVSDVDPHDVIDDASLRAELEISECMPGSAAECALVTIWHTFRAPLEFDIVATSVWDQRRNAWQNFFNHGIEVAGESLNASAAVPVNGGSLLLYPLIQSDADADGDGLLDFDADHITYMTDESGRVYRLAPDGTYRPLSNLSSLYHDHGGDIVAWDPDNSLHTPGRDHGLFAELLRAEQNAAAHIMNEMGLGSLGYDEPAPQPHEADPEVALASQRAELRAALEAEAADAAELAAALYRLR